MQKRDMHGKGKQSPIAIRPARRRDLISITGIYNEAIETTNATFDTTLKTLKEQGDWFSRHGEKYPLLVAELDGKVTGWASLSQWSDRCAYSGTAEISLYVNSRNRGKGVGRRLLFEIVEAGRKAGLHTVIARISEGNAISVHLHESVGFEKVGVMREVGRKFGKLLDVHMYQLIYS